MNFSILLPLIVSLAAVGEKEAIRKIVELRGRLEYDAQGRLAGVDLASDRISVGDAELPLLASLPHLRRLRLSGGGITPAGARHLAALSGLVELSLINAQIDDDGLGQLAGLTRLRLLDLRGCVEIGNPGLAKLRTLTNLKALRLRGRSIDDGTLGIVKDFAGLTSLTVEEAAITDAGLAQLAKLPLEDIGLFRCYGLSDAGLGHLKPLASLRQLSLRAVPITGPGLAVLADKRKLVSLRLNETGVGDEAMKHVQTLTGLVRLELRQTRVGDAGLKHLAGLGSLEYLDLESTRVTDAGLAEVSGLSRLQFLNLKLDLGISDAAIEHLARLKGLKTLWIAQTGITDSGAERLSASLPLCRLERH